MAKSSKPRSTSTTETLQRPAEVSDEVARAAKAAVLAASQRAGGNHDAPVKQRPVDLIQGAKQQLNELTGYPVASVAEFSKREDGWSLTMTVLELSRIPAATDVLAEYIVDLDAAGNIISYHRGRRFYRGEVGDAK